MPSSPTDSTSGRIKAKLATAGIYHSDGRRVSVQFHGSGSTFVPKTLRSMIEEQARWTEEDLKRLKLIR